MAPTLDRLRDRWEHLAPRERRLIAALGATFVVCLVLFISFMIRDGLTAIDSRNSERRDALEALHRYRVAEAERAAKGGPDLVIPDEAIELESYLEGIANQAGIAIPSYGSQRPEETDGFRRISTKISLEEVSIYALVDFLETIETKSKLVVVSSLHINQNFQDEETLDVEMVVSTFERASKAEDGDDEG